MISQKRITTFAQGRPRRISASQRAIFVDNLHIWLYFIPFQQHSASDWPWHFHPFCCSTTIHYNPLTALVSVRPKGFSPFGRNRKATERPPKRKFQFQYNGRYTERGRKRLLFHRNSQKEITLAVINPFGQNRL